MFIHQLESVEELQIRLFLPLFHHYLDACVRELLTSHAPLCFLHYSLASSLCLVNLCLMMTPRVGFKSLFISAKSSAVHLLVVCVWLCLHELKRQDGEKLSKWCIIIITNSYIVPKYVNILHSRHLYIILILLRHFSCRGQNQSFACFDCWPKCATQGHFWLVFTVILTILNNIRQCFYQSKTVDSFLPVNVLTTRKVWQCLTFKCTR